MYHNPNELTPEDFEPTLEDRLKEICGDLTKEGVWPPYTLIIGDGAGSEVHLNVTLVGISFK